jgi:hypothetical protein
MLREHAETVSGHAVKSGHFLPDEAPEDTYRALRGFFAERCDALVDPPAGSAPSQPNTQRRLPDLRPRANSLLFVCSGIQIR